MINGKLTAKGSVNYYREKYNKGYVLSVTRNKDYSKKDFKRKLQEKFKVESLEEDEFHDLERYRVSYYQNELVKDLLLAIIIDCGQ